MRHYRYIEILENTGEKAAAVNCTHLKEFRVSTMQLTKYTDYSLRLLTYLALLPEGKRASIDEVSDIYGVPRNHINKIVHKLGKMNLIETRRGKGGGFFLASPAEDINIGEVVALLENSLKVIDCDSPPCRIQPVCRLKHILNDASNIFLDHLNQFTLADLVQHNRTHLVQILQIQDAPSAAFTTNMADTLA